jgi:uncharacterized membrane protein
LSKFTCDLEEKFPAPPKSKSGVVNRARKSVVKKKKEEDITVIDPQRAMNLIIVMRKLGNKVSLLLSCFAVVVGCCTCLCSLFVKKINTMYVLLCE